MRAMKSPLPHQQAIQRHIGEVLRRSYEPTVCEPIPGDLLKLIDHLEASRPCEETTPEGIVDRAAAAAQLSSVPLGG